MIIYGFKDWKFCIEVKRDLEEQIEILKADIEVRLLP